jgi:hypothetical protein
VTKRRFGDTRTVALANLLIVIVMPGLAPGIHVFSVPKSKKDVDGRDEARPLTA